MFCVVGFCAPASDSGGIPESVEGSQAAVASATRRATARRCRPALPMIVIHLPCPVIFIPAASVGVLSPRPMWGRTKLQYVMNPTMNAFNHICMLLQSKY